MHMVCHFRFDMHHNTFFNFPCISTIQICVEIPHEPWNIAHSIPKSDLLFTSISFQNKQKSNMGEFCGGRPMSCVLSPQNWQKNKLQSSKMRRVWVVNDTNNTFFIRYGYQTVKKKETGTFNIPYTDMHAYLLICLSFNFYCQIQQSYKFNQMRWKKSSQ